MALRLRCTNPDTGQVVNYWRLDDLHISTSYSRMSVTFGGYASREWRLGNGRPGDVVTFLLGPEQFVPFAQRTLFDDLKSAGHAVDTWCAESQLALKREITANVVARGAYRIARLMRRAIPVGAEMNNETGEVVLPTGEVIAATDVDHESNTIPSLFAQAEDD